MAEFIETAEVIFLLTGWVLVFFGVCMFIGALHRYLVRRSCGITEGSFSDELLSIFTFNSTNTSDDGDCDGAGCDGGD